MTYLGKHTIQHTVQKLAARMDTLIEHDVTVVCVLSGGFMLYADLLAYSQRKSQIKTGFVHVQSYVDDKKSNRMRISSVTDINTSKVILVDDILDSGETIVNLEDFYKENSIEVVGVFTLLAKQHGLDWSESKINAPIYFGRLIDKEDFVYGYGLDYQGHGRALDTINSLKL